MGLLVAALSASATSAAPGFAPTSLVVTRIGDGAAALTGPTAPVFLDEYTQAGLYIDSLAIPTSASGGNFTLTMSGTSTSQGHLTRSVDGRFLTLTGFDAPVGTSGASSNSSFRGRTIGRVDALGNVNTTTRYEASGMTPRSAVTVDGSAFWTTADSGSGDTGGLRYHQLGASANGVLLNSAATNLRVVNIFNSQLYISGATANTSGNYRGVLSVGTGLPTTAGQAFSLFPGMGGSNAGLADSAYDFFLANSTTLYLADDDTTAPASGGLQKWTFDGSTWTKAWQITPLTRSLTGRVLGNGDVELFAISASSTSAGATDLIRVLDTGAGIPVSTVLATSPTNTVFRGVDFAPIPEPATLLLLAGAGMIVLRRRSNAGA
jgi:hypothetical protein